MHTTCPLFVKAMKKTRLSFHVLQDCWECHPALFNSLRTTEKLSTMLICHQFINRMKIWRVPFRQFYRESSDLLNPASSFSQRYLYVVDQAVLTIWMELSYHGRLLSDMPRQPYSFENALKNCIPSWRSVSSVLFPTHIIWFLNSPVFGWWMICIIRFEWHFIK